jgi:hypothetical protein
LNAASPRHVGLFNSSLPPNFGATRNLNELSYFEGVAVWGGDGTFNRLMRYAHAQVEI